jgi:hypothetical protein
MKNKLLLGIVVLLTPALGAWRHVNVLYNKGGAATTVTYSGIVCGLSGGSTTETCNPGSTPTTGSAVVGFVFILNQSSTLTSVCDGTGANGCTGSSTYTIKPIFTLGSASETYAFFTCNYVGTGTTGTLTFVQTAAQGMYGEFITATGNTTTGTACNDGYAQAQNTSAVTTYTSGTVTTTNAHDLLVGMFGAQSASAFTAGTDGQGNTYTARDSSAGAVMIETLAESATNTYSASATGSSSTYNAMVFAIK